MITEKMTKKAVRAVFGHLRKKFRKLDRDELRSAAGFGVAKAIKEYDADRTQAAYLWLKIAGTQRAINALREYGFLGKGCMQNPTGSPNNPLREADLRSKERNQFATAPGGYGDAPFPLELFNHLCLTGNESAVLIARYADNHTWKELAERLGVSQRTCQRRHDSALKKLHRVLGEKP